MEKIKELYKKYKEIIMYLIFGGLTTLVNIVAYFILGRLLNIETVISTVIAQIISILFAYITNKIFVFESKTTNKKDLLREMISFFACRGLSAVMDVAIMYVTVDLCHFNDMIMKIISNIIVIIVNYVFSKLIIFKKKKQEQSEG